jgi:Rrf2 family protein
MLKVTTQGRYALRAMLDLALHGADGPVPRRDIAERQELSPDYVAHLFGKLRDAGLVLGIKGPNGGYLLSRAPESILVGEIVQAVEGPIVAADCVQSSGEKPCQRLETCVTHRLWARLSTTIVEYLNSVTLADICSEARDVAREATAIPKNERAALAR